MDCMIHPSWEENGGIVVCADASIFLGAIHTVTMTGTAHPPTTSNESGRFTTSHNPSGKYGDSRAIQVQFINPR